MCTIFVFKTSVGKAQEVKQLRPVLNALLSPTALWNFDLEDCDRILRIEAENLCASAVQNTLHSLGYVCEELH